jgi:hypothetical protein
MLSRIARKDRLWLALVLGTVALPLSTIGCWHERREPVVYVDPHRDDHLRHEEIRHEVHEEHEHRD